MIVRSFLSTPALSRDRNTIANGYRFRQPTRYASGMGDTLESRILGHKMHFPDSAIETGS